MNLSEQAQKARENLQNSQRIVVKVGTRVLVDSSGKPSTQRIASLARQLAHLQKQGREIILVTSGAVGAGMQVLAKKRTSQTSLADLQMAAAIGQIRLMELYQKHFRKNGCHVSQVLLTHDDLKHRQRHLNARNTMLNLLRHKVIPIVNENDVISVDEMRVGDNDVLSAMVTSLIDADLLILLTTPNGFLQPLPNGKSQRIPFLNAINDDILKFAIGKSDTLSTGGMSTKLKAAQTAVKSGARVVIASGRQKNILLQIMQGQDVGTLITDTNNSSPYQSRKRWIAFFHKPQGTLIIDDGAAEALRKKGKSLLPIGIHNVEGNFSEGDLVNISDNSGKIIAQGLVSYSSGEIKKIQGHHALEIIEILGRKDHDEIIHRDNLTLVDE